jgi:hypothetical protein
MVVVGAHSLPFVFLYGMPALGALAGVLVAGAVAVMYLAPGVGVAAGRVTCALLVVAGLVLRSTPTTAPREPSG